MTVVLEVRRRHDLPVIPPAWGLPRGTDLSWVRHAACRDSYTPGEPDLWYPPEGKGSRSQDADAAEVARIDLAKSICASCPVTDSCRSLADSTADPYGIWAGEEPADRKNRHRRERRAIGA